VVQVLQILWVITLAPSSATWLIISAALLVKDSDQAPPTLAILQVDSLDLADSVEEDSVAAVLVVVDLEAVEGLEGLEAAEDLEVVVGEADSLLMDLTISLINANSTFHEWTSIKPTIHTL